MACMTRGYSGSVSGSRAEAVFALTRKRGVGRDGIIPRSFTDNFRRTDPGTQGPTTQEPTDQRTQGSRKKL